MEVVLNATAFHMDVRNAVDAVRLDHEWMPDSVTFERGAVPATLDSLRAMGHGIKGGQIAFIAILDVERPAGPRDPALFGFRLVPVDGHEFACRHGRDIEELRLRAVG